MEAFDGQSWRTIKGVVPSKPGSPFHVYLLLPAQNGWVLAIVNEPNRNPAPRRQARTKKVSGFRRRKAGLRLRKQAPFMRLLAQNQPSRGRVFKILLSATAARFATLLQSHAAIARTSVFPTIGFSLTESPSTSIPLWIT